MEKKWLYLIVLSVIWGTSFILIKKGLVGLTQIQLGSLRTVMTAIILFSVGLPTLKQIRKSQWKWIALSALFGTFFPAFLFAFAQKQQLSEAQTLACFGDYYRKDVLENPQGEDHQNIRQFMKSGWFGIAFSGDALAAKE